VAASLFAAKAASPIPGDDEMTTKAQRAVYQKVRATTIALLGFDPGDLTPTQSARVDVATALRFAIDDMQQRLLNGQSVDSQRLLAASEALARLMPPSKEPSSEITGESARQKLLQTVLAVIAAEDAESSQAASEMESIAAAMENDPAVLRRLECAERVITPGEADVIEPLQFAIGGVARGPDDPPPPSQVIVDVTPNQPPAPVPPAYDYVRNQDWKSYINSDGSIRSTPRGRWSI
jgi:hypothetical protein